MARKILLEHIDVPGINTYDVYRSKGGYASVEKALKTMNPQDVVEEVKKSGLRGRGGAGGRGCTGSCRRAARRSRTAGSSPAGRRRASAPCR